VNRKGRKLEILLCTETRIRKHGADSEGFPKTCSGLGKVLVIAQQSCYLTGSLPKEEGGAGEIGAGP